MEQLIEKLVNAFGPSSKEDEVKEIIRHEIEHEVDQIGDDKFGNLIAHVEGSGEKLIVAAHMDSIGVMVTDIDKNGFLRIGEIGGLRKSFLVGQRILFENGIEGFVYYEDKESPWEVKDFKIEKFFVDIGAYSKAKAKEVIQIGTEGIYKPYFYKSDKRIIAPSLDDRIGCAIAVQAIRNLKRKKVKYDTYFVFTVQEEIGVKGARTSAYEVTPDIGISLDVTDSGDTPESYPVSMNLGDGPTIKIKDGGMISSKYVRDELVRVAKKEGIPYQLEVISRGTTDAFAMQTTKSGILSGSISISTRYIHTPSEVVDLNDIENGINLLKKFIEK
jgi:putative aminopeptidase FrvX